MPDPIIVDIYCQTEGRTLEDQADMEKQEKLSEAYCQEHDLTVGMVNQDSTSAWHYGNRFGLTRMRQRYREGKIRGIVMTDIRKLSRSLLHQAILLQEMETIFVTLYLVQEPLEVTLEGKVVRLLVALLNQVEEEKHRESVTDRS